MLYVNEKELVVPGELLAANDGYYSGRGTFEENDKIYSSLLGLVSLRNERISVIPLKSKYIPKKGDVVIGKVEEVKFSMWDININSPYSGILPSSEVFGRDKKELSQVFDVGDVLFLRIVDVDEVKKVRLGLKGRGMGKFNGGIIVSIAPTKVPRLIGKKGSMINMIKDKTDCKIVVGQNGLVWINGKKDMEQITKEIISLIEKEAHTSGLTDRIKNKLSAMVDGEDTSIFDEKDDVNKSFDEGLEKPKLQDFKSELEDELASDSNLEGNSTDVGSTDDSSNLNLEEKSKDVGSSDDSSNLNLEGNSTDVGSSDDSLNPNLEGNSTDVGSTDDSSNLNDLEANEKTNDNKINKGNIESSEKTNKNSLEELNDENGVHLNQKHKKIKFSKKANFLDTFEYIKSQEKTKKPSFTELGHADNSRSPTLNISSNNSKKKKSPQWRKTL